MSMTGNKFKLGMFFFFGTVVFILLIVWLTGGFQERQTTPYVSYFPWSVQGLNEGSNVMYNGVPVGRVASIDIAPDGRLVEVVMKIRSDFEVDTTIVATMQLIGITGLQVINLSTDSVSIGRTVRYSFEPEHKVIPVEAGAIQTATGSLMRLAEIMHEVDFQAISDQFLRLLENTNAILASDKIEKIEASIISNSENLDSLLVTYTRLGRDLNRLVVRLDRMAPELAENLDSLIVELHALSEPLGRFANTLDELLVESSEVLNSLSLFLETLRSNPSELLIRTSGEGVWQ